MTVKLKILEKMIEIRMVEQFIAEHYSEQKMKCPAHLCLGQEAVPAVLGCVAQTEDIFVGTCRSHGFYLAKNGNLVALLAELLGKPSGCSKGFGGSMHLIEVDQNFWGTSAIVSGGIPIAAGAALAQKYRKESAITIVFLGDAAVEEGVVYETINFAVLHQLPILFVCENNRLAITTPIELRQSRTHIYDRFEKMGLPGYQIKENDLNQLIKIAEQTYQSVKKQSQPSFIEYQVSRWSTHVGPDFEGPIDAWWKNPAEEKHCPLCAFINDLIKQKLMTLSQVKKLKEIMRGKIEKAYEQAINSEDFKELNLMNHVYHAGLQAELPNQSKKTDVSKFKFKEPSKLINPF